MKYFELKWRPYEGWYFKPSMDGVVCRITVIITFNTVNLKASGAELDILRSETRQ